LKVRAANMVDIIGGACDEVIHADNVVTFIEEVIA
jgi:hypothetical protein